MQKNFVMFCAAMMLILGMASARAENANMSLPAEPQFSKPLIIWDDNPEAASAPDIVSDAGGHVYEEALQTTCLIGADFPALAANHAKGKPVIAIVIDDMGLDRKRSRRTVKLPAGVTLAYLPYGDDVQKQVDAAKAAGHQIIVHMPMQPERDTANPGPNYLGVDMTSEELEKRIARNLSAFTGYVGINNHMGSKFTQDRAGANVLMPILKARNLVFLDSVTSPASVVESAARVQGVPTTHRDVFIDHVESAARVKGALAQIEAIARRKGSAVAIGHPKDVTLDALEKWLPTLAAKGFAVVPLTEVIELREGVSAMAASRQTVAQSVRPMTDAQPAAP